MPNLPLIWTEYNASYANEPDVTDAAYMGPWLADTIRQCDGLVDDDVVLDILRCLRRARRGQAAVLWRLMD